MAAKKMDLNKRTFFVLSGIKNALGHSLTLELCRRFSANSVALLIDENEEQLQSLKKELQQTLKGHPIKVIIAAVGDWQQANVQFFEKLLPAALELSGLMDIDNKDDVMACFECAYVLHNEATAATERLMEPQQIEQWTAYLHAHLYAPAALNQAFLRCKEFDSVAEKLVINIRSSLQVQPMIYSQLMCSCKKARDMYFRAMVSEEWRSNVLVLNYGAGILDTHLPEKDINNNNIDLIDLGVNLCVDNAVNRSSTLRVKPLQSTLVLINILEEISFISGRDVDYYDTYNL